MGNKLLKLYKNQVVPTANISCEFDNMPNYYTNLQVTHIDYIRANQSWKLIIDNTCKNHIKKCNQQKSNSKCVVWFYEVFYAKLFEFLPEVKPMFKHSVDKQGKMLVSMISLILNSFYDKSLAQTIKDLILRHIGYGVKIYHFYVMGEVLFSSLDLVLDDEFTDDCYFAWRKIYSDMLRIVIPIIKEKEENAILHKIHMVHDRSISSKGGKYSEISEITVEP